MLPDATTQSVVTDSSGGFDFTGLGPGTYTVAVTVPNGYFSDSTSATVTLDGIAAGSPLTFRLAQFSIVTGSGPNGALPNGSVGDPYCSILSLLNAVDPVTWSISSGTMPTGTGIDSVGHCHGTPTAAGTFNFSLTATDALGRAAGNSYSVQIFPAPAINAPVPLSFAPVDNL